MGATLPLLIRYAVRIDPEVGPRVALLYAINTTGAVFGTVAAAFVLLPALGLNRTVWAGCAALAAVRRTAYRDDPLGVPRPRPVLDCP